MKTWIALLLMSPAFVLASNATAPVVVEPRTLGDQLMKFVAADDMPGLFAHMSTMSTMDKAQLNDSRDNVLKQRKPLVSSLGTVVGFGFVSECRRGDFLSRLVYAEKRSKSVMRWQFIFYRVRDKWQLIYFYWDDKVKELFESCN
jgi:hypothetical protein